MRKLGFFSNLLYALKMRLGWCPEQPKIDTLKKEISMAFSDGYSEMPSLSLYYFVSALPAAVIGIITFFIGQHYSSLFVSAVGILILLVVIPLFTFPYLFNRIVSLTSDGFYVKFGFSKDKIPINDILSVETTDLPETFRGSVRIPGDPQPRGPFIPIKKIPLGIVTSEGTKWYVFGKDYSYLKINRKNNQSICIGVSHPQDFIRQWEQLSSPD